jgi:hypothetical protein
MIDPRASLLMAGCVLFGALIAMELAADGTDNAALATLPARPVNIPVVKPHAPTRVDDLLATSLARPLFSRTRRPPAAALGDDAGADALADKRLAGIIVAPDGRFAIFAVSGAKPLTVTEGATVGDWRVEKIAATEIALSGPNGTKVLKPTPDTDLVRQAPPGVPVAQPGPAPPARFGPPGLPPRPFPPGPAVGRFAPRMPGAMMGVAPFRRQQR